MRMLVYSPQDEYLFDIPYGEIYDGNIRERINGEHVMTLVTSHVLEKEQRVLWRDGMNKWREYVISGVDKAHANGGKPIGTYRGVWSLQHDLQVSQVSKMPGVQSAVSAETALTAALSETNRWNVGNVTVTTMGGTSMYDMQVWDALKALLSMWGGEIDARIEVGTNGVIGRYVDYFEQIGSQTVTRRFTYARDMHEIHRVVEDGVVACRIVPRGKGEASGDGYGRKIKIGDVNDGVDWLQNDAAAALYRLPDGEGDYEYPTVFVDNGDIEDKQVLLDWGREVLNDYTTPNVTYKANVLQLEAAGMDSHGIALGDKVQCADRKFSDEGLIIEGRITELVTYFRDRRRHDVTIGHISEPIAVTLARESAGLKEQLSAMSKQVSETTYSLLHSLLDMINQQINATGGYTYLVEGEGTITYDIEVDDPLVGYNSSTQTWASQVTQMKGGTLRFANSKKPSFAGIGDWNWTNVITADGYLALAATIARITTGFIGNATSGNYWNLDTGEFRIEHGQITLTIQGYRTNGIITMDLGTIADVPSVGNYGRESSSGTYKGMRIYGTSENPDDALYILLDKDYSNSHRAAIVGSTGPLRLSSGVSTSTAYSDIVLYNNSIYAYAGESNTTAQYAIKVSKDGVSLYRAASGIYQNPLTYTSNGSYAGGKISINGTVESTYADITRIDVDDIHADTVECSGGMGSATATIRANNLYVSGTKSRLVNTNNYDERLLYCYESPSPLFGDVGSGLIDDDGTCMVSIDDILLECMRTDMAYQVFLQKCGQGDLWVSEKAPTYFIVGGTPGLSFDWEIKGHQTGYETDRLEDVDMHRASNQMGALDLSVLDLYDDSNNTDEIMSLYGYELNYAREMELLY